MLSLCTYSSGQIAYCALVFSPNYSGCGRCWSMDGNWKLCFPHCMFPVSSSVPNLSNVRFPNVCPKPLKPKSAFCIQHYSKAQTLGYPTDVKGFCRTVVQQRQQVLHVFLRLWVTSCDEGFKYLLSIIFRKTR